VSVTEDEAPWREPIHARYPDSALFGLPGVDQLRARLDGRAPAPPIHYLTGMEPTEVGLGTSAFSMPATRWLLSPQGLISVGTLAILADGPLGCAIQSALPPLTALATSELSLRVLRPARANGSLIARGTLVHAGRSIGLSSVQIFDGDGHLLADGSSLCFIRSLPVEAAAEAPATPSAPPDSEPEPPRLFERPALGEIVGQDVWDRMSGLEFFEARLAGELPNPPIHYLTGAGPVEVGAGEAILHDALPRMALHPAGDGRGRLDRDGG
jgi:uncharacterized protein (TIGR00369 family)